MSAVLRSCLLVAAGCLSSLGKAWPDDESQGGGNGPGLTLSGGARATDSADPADATSPKVLRLRARWDGGGAGGEPMEAPAGFDGGTNGVLTPEELQAAQMAFE